jgi:hypothetical protein
MIPDKLKQFLKEKVKTSIFKDIEFENYWNYENFNGRITKTYSLGMEYDIFINNQKLVEEYGTDDVTYHINEYGYRTSPDTNEIFKENLISCFGCSNTFGSGLKWEETWPYVLNQKMGDDWCVKNYGVIGASNDAISRLIYNYTLNHKPKIICCFFTDAFRLELFSNNRFQSFIKNQHDSNIYKNDYFLYNFFSNYENSLYNFIKNYKFIETICKNKNIKLYWFTWSYDVLHQEDLLIKKFLNYENFIKNIKSSDLEEFPPARDNCHYGVNVNYKIGNEFCKIINENG